MSDSSRRTVSAGFSITTREGDCCLLTGLVCDMTIANVYDVVVVLVISKLFALAINKNTDE